MGVRASSLASSLFFIILKQPLFKMPVNIQRLHCRSDRKVTQAVTRVGVSRCGGVRMSKGESGCWGFPRLVCAVVFATELPPNSAERRKRHAHCRCPLCPPVSSGPSRPLRLVPSSSPGRHQDVTKRPLRRQNPASLTGLYSKFYLQIATCRRRDSNPHGHSPTVFKTVASAIPPLRQETLM